MTTMLIIGVVFDNFFSYVYIICAVWISVSILTQLKKIRIMGNFFLLFIFLKYLFYLLNITNDTSPYAIPKYILDVINFFNNI